MQSLEPFPQPVLEQQSQPPPLAPCQSSSSAPPSQVAEVLMYKNRLQEYAQRAGLQLPIYTTVSEGQSHAPKFRSTVVVDGQSYTSENTFSVLKAAEQGAARVALESIARSIKNDDCQLVMEDKVLCKSILHDFAAKMHLEMPAYVTLELRGQLPAFKCSVAFNGATYSGEIGSNKMIAEQLGARAAILSLLGNIVPNKKMRIDPQLPVGAAPVYQAQTSLVNQALGDGQISSSRRRKNRKKNKKKLLADAQLPAGGAPVNQGSSESITSISGDPMNNPTTNLAIYRT